MSLNVGELVGYLSLDDKDFDRGIKSAHGSLDRLGSEGPKKASKAGALIGGAIGAGFLMAAAKVTEFASGAVDAFAAVEDATGAAGVQFGSALPQVLAFAEKAGASFGLSKRAALDAQNTFGTLGKAAGLQGAPLAAFSGKLAGLAGDLASFKGTSTEQAIDAVGAALRGESEPIRAYGVLLDDATLRLQAVKMGLIKTVKDGFTPAQKALAAQASILAQTKDAQGDYNRTSTSTANVQKTLAAQTENAQAALGQKLAPAVTWARTVMLGFITSLSGAVDKTSELVGWLKQNQAWLGPIAVGVAAMAVAYGTYKGVIFAVQAATKAYAAVQLILNTVMAANPIGLVVLALVGLAAGLVYAYKTSETFRAGVDQAFRGVQQVVGLVVQSVIGYMRLVLTVWGGVIGGLLSTAATVAEKLGLPFAKGLRNASDSFNAMATNADNKLKGIADNASTWGKATGENYAAGIDSQRAELVRIAASVAKSVRYALVIPSLTATAPGSPRYGLVAPGHNAMGTDNWRGGPTWVGERGPEIVNLPKGSQVIPNDKSGSNGADVVAAVKELGDRFGAELQRQARTIQMMQRQMA